MNEKEIEKAIKDARTGQKRSEVADTDRKGLRLRIMPTGSATWVLRCVDPEGRQRRYSLGKWPGMTVSSARKEAVQTGAAIARGADPILEGRKKRAATSQARDGVGTLKAILDLYANTDHAKKLKSGAESRRRIDSVFGRHMARSISALTRTELQLTADGWPSPQSAAAAVRYLRPILKWAAGRDYAPEDLTHIKPPANVGRRDRVLSRAELSALLPALSVSERPYAAAMRFLLLTLVRREELTAARWREVDFEAGTWTIPAERSKNGQPHVVPLSRQALGLLRARLPRDRYEKPLTPAPNAPLFATAGNGQLANWDRETKVIMKASGTKGWTRHDLRRTGATMLGEMGELPDIIEAALNHVAIRSQLAATYNRSRYRPQVASALQRLADALDTVEAAESKAGVDFKPESPATGGGRTKSKARVEADRPSADESD